MSDARDTNRDGHVSLMEKVKDKLHLGHAAHTTATHQTTSTTHIALPATTAAATSMGAYDARDTNLDGHVSMGEKLKGSTMGTSSTGTYDARDTNLDGHVSMGEKLKGSTMGTSTGAYDARDTNLDGHVSMGEKLAAGSSHLVGRETEEQMRLRLHEEQLAISKRKVSAGEVDIHKRVHEQHVQETVPVRHEEVVVERRPLHGFADPHARIAPQDETMRVALFREEIVTEKRIVPTEEVIVRKKEVVDQQTVGATLRSEHVETVQTGTRGSMELHDARDTNLDGHVSMGEKLKGSTMGTSTGAYDARDTNLDGHVSMGEKLKGSTMGAAPKAARG